MKAEKPSLGQLVRDYMVPHKQVTFQSMARSMGVSPDFLYDLVNDKPVDKAIRKTIKRWLKDHRNDPEKIRFI